MKKNNKVYSTSDFEKMTSTVLIEDCYWTISSVSPTSVGEHSGLPLFIIRLRKVEEEEEVGGYLDASSEMDATRTYFVREGRPLYEDLVEVWRTVDRQLFPEAAKQLFWKESGGKVLQKVYKGHVVRLSGIEYNKPSRDGTYKINKNSLELWYPRGYEEDVIVQDFLHMCNKGVYTPILQDPVEKQDPLAGVDPAIVAAVMAALGKK